MFNYSICAKEQNFEVHAYRRNQQNSVNAFIQSNVTICDTSINHVYAYRATALRKIHFKRERKITRFEDRGFRPLLCELPYNRIDAIGICKGGGNWRKVETALGGEGEVSGVCSRQKRRHPSSPFSGPKIGQKFMY